MNTRSRRSAVALGAIALGSLALARPWRHFGRGYSFAGRSVLITGGSRGLGLVLARELAAEDARLTLVARDEQDLERAAADVRRYGPDVRVLTAQGDIRRRYEADRAVAQAVQEYGGVDVLINNAGIIQVGPIDHMKMADFDDAMNTHFWGPLHMIGAVLPYMRRAGGGRIVNVSSIGGKIAVPHLVPYSASKFALVGLSDGLRAELFREGIVVTTVCPGLMRTGSPLNASFKGRRREEYAWFAVSDSMPLLTVDARRAARKIISACRHGDAELVIGVPAKAAVLARNLAPNLIASVAAAINGWLPKPAVGAEGDEARPGRELESVWAEPKSPLTLLTYKAAAENNEM